jgi:rod shape-determining protein MreD
MKPRVYVILFLLIVPFQASLLDKFAIGGAKPDLALAALFVIGLLTGPVEAAIAGMGIGLLQDIASASLIGFSGLTRGLVGLGAGLLGKRFIDSSSPAVVPFLAVFSLAEGLLISSFLQVTDGAVPFFSMIAGRLLPQAIYTSLLGLLVLRLVSRKNVLPMLKRRDLQKEL